jgi:hypothetical protein
MRRATGHVEIDLHGATAIAADGVAQRIFELGP